MLRAADGVRCSRSFRWTGQHSEDGFSPQLPPMDSPPLATGVWAQLSVAESSNVHHILLWSSGMLGDWSSM